MKRFFPLVATLLAATMAQADPYCAQLLDARALPKKVAKIAPVYSDMTSGWVFTQDQLKDRYDMKDSSRRLVQAIVTEFAKRDVPLAIVVAPPRPVVAGQAQLDAAMGGTRYDVGAAQASFDALIQGLSDTGAIVPNLSNAALADPDMRDGFYFRRDTHWTTVGSAIGAIALGRAVNAQLPDLFPKDGQVGAGDLVPSGTIEEKGSLASVVYKTCGTQPDPETAQSFDLARDGDLLAAGPGGPAIALVGSSFSNRHKRDHYRFGEALAWAFDADVTNYSVSGGGPIGAIEAYVLSGALDRRAHALVVWEIPYTESFNAPSFLRQLLGALQRPIPSHMFYEQVQGASPTTIKLDVGADVAGIEIVPEDLEKQAFDMEVRFDNGSKSKVYLGRRAAVPVDMRSPRLFSSFAFFGKRKPTEIVISPLKGARIAKVGVF